MKLVSFGGVLRTSWFIVIFALLIEGRNFRRKKQVAGPCDELPHIGKSRMCRCLIHSNSTGNYVDPPKDSYILESVDIDYIGYGPQVFPEHADTVCAYFGHAGSAVTDTLVTQDFVINAINEYGWPTGNWSVAQFRGTCHNPKTSLLRTSIGNKILYEYFNCYDKDLSSGMDEGWYTDFGPIAIDNNPNLFHYQYPMMRKYGMTALLHINSRDVDKRPKKIKFVVEAAFLETTTMSKADLLRIESTTYDVQYPSPGKINLVPSTTGDIAINLDYFYQVRQRNPPGNDFCLPPPPPPPPIPLFDEVTCSCFIRPRQPVVANSPSSSGQKTKIIDRLDLGNVIPPFYNSSKVPADLLNYYIQHNNPIDNFYLFHPAGVAGMVNILVILYAFLPVYKDRRWREREMVMADFRYDTGLPAGEFVSPHYPASSAALYANACDLAVANLSNPKVVWTRPPYPAVGKCVPPDPKAPGPHPPCYFHIHGDYFYADCIESCEEPKYICAVWKHEPAVGQLPFEFQFISNAVYYENNPVSKEIYELPPGSSACLANLVPGVKDWNLLETHLFNKAFHKRSDVWIYNPFLPARLKFVDISNFHADTIPSPKYLNETQDAHEEDCIPPATYFLETKDNNLCYCTFWKENIETWQTHYGRTTSCFSAGRTKEFHEHFKIDFHSRLKDNVKVRVFADVVALPDLLETYFVLHAVYIQAFDQYGLPVGRFHQDHWYDPNNPSDTLCPHQQFPSNTNGAYNRYPIFDLRDCPPQHGIPELKIPKFSQNPNLFLYQNRWRDPYPIVCAQYSFKKRDFPHVTSIQFMAFIRLEDKIGDGHAYMVEIRSGTLDATDLSAGQAQVFATGVHEDKSVSYPPLNYHYYSKSLKLEGSHYKRDCISPVREPDRLFDVCRYYVTTPDTKPERRFDLDKEIDKYNHMCVQWITASSGFGVNHTYTEDLKAKLVHLKAGRDYAIKIKQCFSLNAYKTRRKNAWHVRFRTNNISVDPDCYNFRQIYLKEAAIVAYNEEGYPTGRAGGKREFGGSFELYNHHETLTAGRHEHCTGDDIQLTLDDEIHNAKMAFFEEKGMCFWDRNPTYFVKDQLFHQDFDLRNHKDFMPSLFLWGNFGGILNGFCAIWIFPSIFTNVLPPKHIQFVLEAHIVHEDILPPPTFPIKENKIITIRSPKYKFRYASTNHMSRNPPSPKGDSIHPLNLDSTGPLGCHQVEQDIINVKQPTDKCTCELRIVNSTTGGTLLPGQKPLCVVKYEYYNHFLDNRLYRICLSGADLRHGNEQFPLDDCRTKLEYPRPPEVFPNEQITLTNVDEDNNTIPINLEPVDPTDEVYNGCGLIKKCVSRFANDKLERECLRSKSCGMVVTFGKGLGESHSPMEEVTMEIYAEARGWAAVGISPEDEKMGGDYVIECTKEGGEVNIYNSWNIKSGQPHKLNHTNMRMRGDQGMRNPHHMNIRPVKTIFYQDKLYCKFYIKKKFTKIDPDLGEEHKYDLDKFYYYIMAYSHALTEPYGEEQGNVRTHLWNGGMSETGKESITAGERLSPLPHEARKFRLHALFLTLGWMFFLTLSIFVARYFKETLLNKKILKMEFWYFVHIATAILAAICLGIGLTFQFSGAYGWRSEFRSNFHTYSGIVSFCLFVSEIIIGCFMKKGLEPLRAPRNWAHIVMGHVCYNLGLMNLAFADRVAYSFLACNFSKYIWVWITVYYILHAIMSYHYCWIDYILGRSMGSQKYGAFNVLTQAPHVPRNHVGNPSHVRGSMKARKKQADLEAQRQKNAKPEVEPKVQEVPGKFIRMVALIMFSLITTVYTFWAIRKLVTYPKACYDFNQLKYLEEHGFN